MEKGSLIERRLDNAVFREIRKINKDIVRGAAIGNDYSDIGDIVAADGAGDEPEIAWIKALNNFSCSGSAAVGARLMLMLPENCKENFINRCMAEFMQLSEWSGIQIVGGHTQVSECFKKAFFTVEIFGKSSGRYGDKKALEAGCGIVMCGYAGMLGTDLLIKRNFESISKRFGKYFSQGYMFGAKECCIAKAAEAANSLPDGNVLYMHDISGGGVYAALWQLGRYLDCGFTITNSRIAIKQETIEICEALDKNPYMIDGTGGLLLVCKDPNALMMTLELQGIEASCIGRIGENKERRVAFGDDEMRTLAAPVGDESY